MASETGTNPGSDMGWIHIFERGHGPTTLLLLHGTGANEHQLLGLGRQVAPEAHLLSVRGRSLEEGFPRFFRRFTATEYDQEHLISEALALADFVGRAAEQYQLDPAKVYALGYSNGANIALASLSLRPGPYAGAVLLRPVLALAAPPETDLRGKNVLVLNGRRDPFLPMATAIVPYLSERGAETAERTMDAGHELSSQDVTVVRDWLRAVS